MTESVHAHADPLHERFITSPRRHILMVTNHGVHEWRVIPGLTDTGGQNVYVNQFTETLVAQGYRVTIVNRGGYPHIQTGRLQRGLVYHDSGHARIMYLEDGLEQFVRKEDMDERLPLLCENLTSRFQEEGTECALIISHYWDGGKLAAMYNRASERAVPHIWVPHSLGALKKRNVDPSNWGKLRIDERIANERQLLHSVDGAVATSSAIRDTLQNDYGHRARYFLPPCVDEHRYRPRPPEEVGPIWRFLSENSGLDTAKLKERKIVTEISRTDTTKRKDVLIKAFARVHSQMPEALLLVSIDQRAATLYESLLQLIVDEGVEKDVIVLGSVWDQLPLLYNVTDVFCTPSIMEGFGMSAQEAAATGKPVIASDLVPFVCEYLLGPEPTRLSWDHDPTKDLLLGRAGVVVPADFIEGFASAITRILGDDDLRRAMGAEAMRITVPYFTWGHMTADLMSDLGFAGQTGAAHE